MRSSILIPSALALLVTAFYFYVFFNLSTNTPYGDDYYDALYFIHLYLRTESPLEKLELLLWQYNEHKQALNKIAYIAQYEIFGRIDFFWISFLASLQLPIIALMIWRMFRTENSSNYLILIPFLLIVNVAHWEASYWAVTSIGNLAAISFALLIILLASSGRNTLNYMGALAIPILIFSFGNGILIIPVFIWLIWISQNKLKHKIILMLISLFYLAIFVTNYNFESHIVAGESNHERISKISGQLSHVPIYFFQLVGSTIFTSDAELFHGTTVGLILCVLSLNILFHAYKNNKVLFFKLFSFLTYCFTSLLILAAVRGTEAGYAYLYSSHYKIYSSSVLSIVILYYFINYFFKFYVAIMASLLISLWMYAVYLPEVKKNSDVRHEEITGWAISGLNAGESATRWMIFADQILYMSAKEQIYSPFHSPKSIPKLASVVRKNDICPSANIREANITIINNSGRMGLGIYSDSNTHFDSVLLCTSAGQSYYANSDTADSSLIIEKSKMLPGEYGVYLIRHGKIIARSTTGFVLKSEKYMARCPPAWGPRYKVSLQIAEELCPKVFK